MGVMDTTEDDGLVHTACVMRRAWRCVPLHESGLVHAGCVLPCICVPAQINPGPRIAPPPFGIVTLHATQRSGA